MYQRLSVANVVPQVQSANMRYKHARQLLGGCKNMVPLTGKTKLQVICQEVKIRRFWRLNRKSNYYRSRKAFWEKQAENPDKKAIFFDMMIDMTEKEFNIPIRKNSLPEQSADSQDNTKRVSPPPVDCSG